MSSWKENQLLASSLKCFICKIPRKISSAKYQEMFHLQNSKKKTPLKLSHCLGLKYSYLSDWWWVEGSEWEPLLGEWIHFWKQPNHSPRWFGSKLSNSLHRQNSFLFLKNERLTNNRKGRLAAPLIYQNETASRVTVQLWSTTKVAIRLLVRGSVTNVFSYWSRRDRRDTFSDRRPSI